MATPRLGRSALGRVDLVISQGSDLELVLRYLTGDPDSATPLVPVDLTGWTARAQVRRSVASADTWLDVVGEVDADGYVTLRVPHDDTEGELWDQRDSGVWDLELSRADGYRVRFAEGDVTVSHEVTRD